MNGVQRAMASACVFAIAIGLLVACASSEEGPAVESASSPLADEPGGALGSIDEATLDGLDERKASFDEWMHGWRTGGCDQDPAAAPELCAGQLAEGQLLAAATAIDFGALPDFGMGDQATEEVARSAERAQASGEKWTDAGCAGAEGIGCADLTTRLVDDLEALQETLLGWTR